MSIAFNKLLLVGLPHIALPNCIGYRYILPLNINNRSPRRKLPALQLQPGHATEWKEKFGMEMEDARNGRSTGVPRKFQGGGSKKNSITHSGANPENYGGGGINF